MSATHRYLPQSEDERNEMLRAVGVARAEDLFASIPERLRLRTPLDVPGPLAEQDLIGWMAACASGNRLPEPGLQFLGAGAYQHFAPALVDHLVSRAEFYSSYTPYQPEISQGNLQAVYEYQTLIGQLTGLPVANASMYEGASTLAEAVLMAERVAPRGRVLVSEAVHPEYLRVVRTYVANMEIAVDTFATRPDGSADPAAARRALETKASAVVIQHPNFLGCLEDVEAIAADARKAGAVLIVVVTEPVALGLLKPPGAQGAGIVLGEGQGLGVPLSYGGPYLGFLAADTAYMRQMPGRLVGEARDVDGRRGYVLTLATREQHIRREKATSNICTNEGLCALTAAIFMATLGKGGLLDLARQNHARAAYARERIGAAKGCTLPHAAPFFNEFVVRLPIPAADAVDRLATLGLAAGVPLSRYLEGRERDLLVAVTETNPRAAIDRLADALSGLA